MPVTLTFPVLVMSLFELYPDNSAFFLIDTICSNENLLAELSDF
jgi:hypothetical protein